MPLTIIVDFFPTWRDLRVFFLSNILDMSNFLDQYRSTFFLL